MSLVLLRRALWGGVVLGLLCYLGLSLWLGLSGIFFPYQLDYGEGIVLWFTRQMAMGQSIYKGMEGLPYASSNYPPLGMLLAVPFQWLLGNSYASGRWLNLAAAMLVACLLYRMVKSEVVRENAVVISSEARNQPRAAPSGLISRFARNDRPGTFIAALSALLFFGSTFVYHWLPLFRIDLIGLAFAVAGIFAVWNWEKDSRRRYLVAAAILFLAALYTKHSLFIAPAAAALAITLRDRKTAVLWSGSVAIIGGVLFLALDLATDGGFRFGLIDSNATLWIWDTFWPLFQTFAVTYLLLILLAAAGWIARVRSRRLSVLELYGAGALASTLLAGRVGAWENYYLEAAFAVCLFAGLGMAALWRRPAAQWAIPIALIVQLFLFWDKHDPAIAQRLMDETRASNQAIAPLLEGTNGTIIAEDMGLLVTNGRPIEYYTFQYSSLARSGAWDQHWELDNLRAGAFHLVILNRGTREDVDHFRNFTREFMSALDLNYQMVEEAGMYRVYRPAPLTKTAVYDFGGLIKLVGWRGDTLATLSPGRELTLPIVWQAQKRLASSYTAFLHLEDASGGVVAQDDHPPRIGLASPAPYPTTRWAADEMVRDVYRLRIPESIKPGTYSLRVGWYDQATEDRLPVAGGEDFVELAQFEVK